MQMTFIDTVNHIINLYNEHGQQEVKYKRELYDFLESLSTDEVCMLLTLMYVGRPSSVLPQDFESQFREWRRENNKAGGIGQIVSKSSVHPEYLPQGLKLMQERSFDFEQFRASLSNQDS